MEKFDLTTNSGLNIVMRYLGTGNIIAQSPLLMVGRWLIDKIFTTPEEQGLVISDLIKKGKENGVSVMEIQCHDKGGLNLNIPTDECSVDFHVGKDQVTKIRVKYK